MKKYGFIFLVLVLFSCQSKEEISINAEYSKLIGQWDIVSYNVPDTVPDSYKNLLTTGGIIFNKCDYQATKKEGWSCDGDFESDKSIFYIFYRYDKSVGGYIFKVGIVNKLNGTFVQNTTEKQAKVMELMSGQWEFTINDNKLIARQIKNTALSNILIGFTAMRK